MPGKQKAWPFLRRICESGEETVGMTFWPHECHRHILQCCSSWQQTITLPLHLQLFWLSISSVGACSTHCVHHLPDSLRYFCSVKAVTAEGSIRNPEQKYKSKSFFMCWENRCKTFIETCETCHPDISWSIGIKKTAKLNRNSLHWGCWKVADQCHTLSLESIIQQYPHSLPWPSLTALINLFSFEIQHSFLSSAPHISLEYYQLSSTASKHNSLSILIASSSFERGRKVGWINGHSSSSNSSLLPWPNSVPTPRLETLRLSSQYRPRVTQSILQGEHMLCVKPDTFLLPHSKSWLSHTACFHTANTTSG